MNIIPKHLSGGPVTIVYQPLERPLASLTMAAYAAGDSHANASSASGGEATSSSSSKSKSDEGLLTKDLIKEAYTKGLPSDVAEFMSKVNIFGNDLFGLSNGLSSSNYKLLVSMLSSLLLNKEQYTKALEHATSKNTLNEPAITSDGKVFVLGSDGLITKSVSEVGKDEKTLSVGELSLLRAYSKDLAFDNGTLTNAIAGSISIQDVFKSIQDVVSKIGNSEVESEVIGRKSGKAVTKGLEALLSEAEDGTYKIKQENKNQVAQAKVALQYILASLPTNQLALLLEYARRHGMDTSQGPLVLIKSFIQGQLSDVSKLTIASAPNSSSSGDGSDGSNKKTKMTFPMLLITGDGLAHSTELISFGTGEAYSVDVQSSPQIPLASGGIVKAGDASKILESQLGGIIESDSIHVGEQLISPMALSRMYYDGSGVKAMWLPVKKDNNGKDMPNMDLMKKFMEVQQRIKNLSTPPTPQQVNAMLREAGLSDYYSADGQVLSNYRRFAVISVLGDEAAFKDPDESKAFTEVDDDAIRETFSRSLGTEKNPLKIEGDLYRTNLFIPLYDSPSLARQAGGNPGWVPDNGWLAEEQAYSEVQALKNFKQPQPKSAL